MMYAMVICNLKNYCRMLNVGEHFKFVIWVHLTFAVFKFGECHVWRSILYASIVYGEFYFGESKEPR